MKHVTKRMTRQHFEDPSVPHHEWIVPIVFHLLRQCKACVKAIHEAFARWAELEPDDPRVERDAFEYLYRRGIPEEVLTRQARIDADELLELDLIQRTHRLADEEIRFCSPALVDELLARCEASLTVDAAAALELAELAVEISRRTDPDIVGSLAFQARARAEAHYGNCLRINDHRPGADFAFRRAASHCEQSPQVEPELQAELYRLEASLVIDQRCFGRAERLLGRAISLYQRLGDAHSLGLSYLKRAHAAYQRGEPAAGLDDLRQAGLHFGPEERRYYPMVCFNLALYAVEAGDVELARNHLDRHRHLLESQEKPWFTVRLLWLRAKIARAEGRAETARELYEQAREGFVAEGMGYDAALVSMELTLLYLDAGDWPAVEGLAAEMGAIFEAQDVHREALAALALFQQAALAQELTTELAASLRRYLELAQQDPSLSFRKFDAAFSEHPD